MWILSDITTGTVSVSAGGTVVTGIGTAWATAEFREGDIFIAPGWSAIVQSVQSDTQLTLYPTGIRGAALTNSPYRLRYMSDGSRSSAQARQLIDLLQGTGNLEAFAGLNGLPDYLPMFTGAGTMTAIPLSSIAPDLSGYATIAQLDAGLAGKFNNPTGTTAQYIRGDGSLDTLGGVNLFGWGADNANIPIPNNNADTLTINGVYRTTSSTVGTPNTLGQLIHAGQGATVAFQIFLGNTTNGVLTRQRNTSGVWTEWRDGLQENAANFGIYGGSSGAFDYNDLLPGTTGLYSASNGTNTPPATSGVSFWWVETQRLYSNNAKRQIATGYSSSGAAQDASIYARVATSGGGVWGPWKSLGGVEKSYVDIVGNVSNVMLFGAVGNGTTNNTAAFAAAVAAAPAINNEVQLPNYPRAPSCKVFVPAGNFLLSSVVDTGGKHVYWMLDQATNIINIDNLTGTVLREGQRAAAQHYGTKDDACTFSLSANRTLDASAQVLGIANANQIGTYTDRDTVTMYVENTGPAVLANIATATYTATTITPGTALTAAQRLQLRRGMIIDTKHSPKRSGVITSWTATTITVDSWRIAGTNTATTPANGTGAFVNPMTKIWAHNANVHLTSTSHASVACGFELGMVNDKAASATITGDDHTWGFDSVNLGTYRMSANFMARGESLAGYVHWNGPSNSALPFVALNNAGQTYFSVSPGGAIEFGNQQGVAGTPFFDFHSSAFVKDYDTRLLAVGGNATAGNGSLLFAGSSLGALADAGSNLGAPSNRWNTVYASTGTINTSDERDKVWLDAPSEQELSVAKQLSKLIGFYKWKAAVFEKADKARIHTGVKAQDVRDVFEAHGLDGFKYGVLCYDEWDEVEEVREGHSGKLLVPAQEAGNRFGVRYDELFAFIALGFEARLSALEV